MIKLKIGSNYLITTNRDPLCKSFICYMMSRFSGQGKTVLGFDEHHKPVGCSVTNLNDKYRDYAQAVREARITELIVLFTRGSLNGENVRAITSLLPGVKLKFVKITKEDDASREFKMAQQVYDAWKEDKQSILNHLGELDEYKAFMTRYKSIPGEIKAIDDNLRAMSKKQKTEGRKVTLKDLEYIKLIKQAHLVGTSLELELYPVHINPSEDLGKLYTKSVFENNKYLYNVCKYLYQGCHFGMVGTKIRISDSFMPEFIETVDHQFDDMFKVNNWSTIGYLHFGQGHLCGGEFNEVIRGAGEYGLEYYFLALKQYITTANVRDLAGARVWWYPIYDDEGKLVYCAGLDILRDALLSSVDSEVRAKIETMSIEEFLKWKNERGISFRDVSIPSSFRSGCQSTQSSNVNSFLQVLEQREPELYKKIMKGSR